ncbi:translation initiation factor IF-6 [Candidatus Haloredivivus sp. G17]|nr:translation initiation factor IF-6 [Candidatus Haloredivivus sp. G17]
MIEKYSFKGSENTGFYTVATNSYILVPPDYREKEFFETDVVETKINKTNLVGLFSAGNSNCLLVPREISQIEQDKLDDSCKSACQAH